MTAREHLLKMCLRLLVSGIASGGGTTAKNGYLGQSDHVNAKDKSARGEGSAALQWSECLPPAQVELCNIVWWSWTTQGDNKGCQTYCGCQNCGAANPCLPYLRQGSKMLFDAPGTTGDQTQFYANR